jgi:predicted kinase
MTETAHTLVAVCGLPGVGKSTVSSHLTDRLDGVRLRTDAIRKELVDEPQYTDAERDRVYEELFDQAERHLTDGKSVVLDATFAENAHRDRIREVADRHDVEFRLIHVVCNDGVVEKRIESREDISDADLTVYRKFKAEFDPLELDHDRIDNSESRARTREQVDALF